MRPVSDEQAAKYSSGFYGVNARVEIDDGTAQFIDLTDFFGEDWLQGISITSNTDVPVATSTIGITKKIFEKNLSPFLSTFAQSSPRQPVDINRRIKVYTSLDGDDEDLVFEGIIENLDTTGRDNVIQISSRDLGGPLQDYFLEDDFTIGTAEAIEDAIQLILDEIFVTIQTNAGDFLPPFVYNIPSLYTPDSPSFVIPSNTYSPGQTAMEMINNLALQIGWFVRYRFDPNTGAYRLSLLGPDRALLSPLYQANQNQILDYQQLSRSRVNIRNYIQLDFLDGGVTPTTVTVSDTDSIERYGYKYMRIVEAYTSAIDTTTEANNMANRALSDLAEPLGDFGVLMRYFPNIQEGDLIDLPADGVNFDEAKTAAVSSFTHNITKQGSTTAVTLRGQPSIGQRFWLLSQGIV